MKGYDTKASTSEHAPEVVEDKVVVFFDDDEDDPGWRISRTTVTRRTTETTEKSTSLTVCASYAEAVDAAKFDDLPVYVRADDRHRAEVELEEAGEAKAQKAATDQARRTRTAAAELAKEK